MASILTSKFHTKMARTFKESVSRQNYYVGIGYDQSYPANLTPRDTMTEENRNFSNLVAIKRVYGNDVEMVVGRRDWTSSDTYAAWTNNDTALMDSPFYAYNNVNHAMYLCVSNNSSIPSTSAPNTLGVTIQTTDDGYQWKYLYSINTSQRTKFLNDSWVPALVDDVVSAAAVSDEYGADPPMDLHAKHVLINSRLQGSEGGDFPVTGANANAKMLCLISNPVESDTETVCMRQTYNVAAGEIASNSGDVLYVNYMVEGIERNAIQTDNIQLVFEF